MFSRVLRYFATGPDLPPFSEDAAAIKREYERRRLSVFLSVTFGYGIFYVGRINFGVVKKPMLQAGVLSTTEMGIIGSSMLVIYAIGKLTNGFLSDRANIRRFMSAALLASAIANLLVGSTGFFLAFAVLWGFNGWFQSVGSAPSVASLSQWFTGRERSTRYGIWACSHAIGEALTFAATAVLVSHWGWRWGFWGPGLICLATGLIISRTLADRPQTLGLPEVHAYRGEAAPPQKAGTNVGHLQLEVLKNPAIWIIGLASASMYVARYGMDHWGVLFLQETKGYTLQQAGALVAVSPIAQIAGSFVSGFISNRFFKSRHNAPALIFAVLEIGCLTAVYLVPPGHPWLDGAAIAGFGVGLGVLLVYLGGLMAVDYSAPRAAGAAMGLVGMFSYLGAAIQDTVTGYLLDLGKTEGAGGTVYSFDSALLFWIGASVVSMLLALSTWSVKRYEDRAEELGHTEVSPT